MRSIKKSIIIILVLIVFVSNLTVANATTSYFNEDFESGTIPFTQLNSGLPPGNHTIIPAGAPSNNVIQTIATSSTPSEEVTQISIDPAQNSLTLEFDIYTVDDFGSTYFLFSHNGADIIVGTMGPFLMALVNGVPYELTGPVLDGPTMYTVRVEMDILAGTADYYLDNALVGEGLPFANEGLINGELKIMVESIEAAEITYYWDNISISGPTLTVANPQTGDTSSNVWIYILLAISVVGAAVLTIRRKMLR